MVYGQVMHSSNNFEISFGIEGFTVFVPELSEFTVFEQAIISESSIGRPEDGPLHWRPTISASYRRTQASGNYFGFSATYGKTNWLEENAMRIAPFGTPPGIEVFSEQRKEETIALGYIYSLSLNKNSPDLQLFMGGEGSVYNNVAENNPLDELVTGLVKRNIFGVRIALVPELVYFVPNSKMTISLRTKLPMIHFERNEKSARSSFISSFFQPSIVHKGIEALAMKRTRFELGIGYFLEGQ